MRPEAFGNPLRASVRILIRVGLMLLALIEVSLTNAQDAQVASPSLFAIDPVGWHRENDTHYIRDQDVARLKDLNVKWVRMEIPWSVIEPEPGVFDWRETDRLVDLFTGSGLSVLAVVQGSAPHACRVENPPASFDFGACPPALPQYRKFLKIVVARYKDRVQYWEIWNEPNDATFWAPSPDPRGYAELLSAAFTTIKSADSRARVLFGGIGPIIDADGNEVGQTETYYPFIAFAEETLSVLGEKADFDAYAVHPYRIPKGPLEKRKILLENGNIQSVTFKEEMLALKGIFDRFGHTRKKLWITELGWGADDLIPSKLEGQVSEEQQANYLEQVYLSARNDKELSFIESVFWWSLKDVPETPPSIFTSCGLLRRDLTPKQAYYKYRQLATPP